MFRTVSQISRNVLARPRALRRAALLAGGAVTGAAVSVAASVAVVETYLPRANSAAHVAPGGKPLQASLGLSGLSLPGISESPLPGDSAVTPLPVAVDPAMVAPLPGIAPAPELTTLTEPAPEALPEAVVDLILGRPAVEPPARPAALTNARLAAEYDLPARAVTRPLARPGSETGAATGAPVVLAALATLPDTRPLPRPAVLSDAVYRIEDTVIAETLAAEEPATGLASSLRPEPRPQVVRVATAAPQTVAPAEEAAPRVRRASGVCGKDLVRDMPRRRSNAAAGSAFFAGLGGLSGTDRDAQVIAELGRGNMPDFLRDLQPVTFIGQDNRGAATEITICVTPDYLALGSDRDYVRVPLGLPAASRIAGAFDMTLPTPRMVDAIYAQADVHLSPAPMQAGPQMTSTDYLLRHNATIQGQLQGRSGLIAGQKKDVVMASRMASNPGKVAIYGWHRSNTSPIQPVSTVHQASYADYSHGIRLVSRTAFLNGRPVDIDDLLASSRYAYLLNSDGPLPGPVIRIASR